VGNSPWDGETGASNNPGKGNHQDGQDPETNQPPGDSKNNKGQGKNSQDDESVGDLIDKFGEENPGTEWYEEFNNNIDLDVPEHSIYEVPDAPMFELFVDTNYDSSFPEISEA
jgi:hypothetical protein